MSYRFLFISFWGLATLQQASGIVLSYYRFEVDNDPSDGLNTPNEIAGLSPLTAVSAGIDTSTNAPNLPGETGNDASLDGLGDLNAPNIDASAEHDLELDVDSLTVEFFARTEESTAVMVARSTTDLASASVQNQDGFRIYDTQDLKVDFWTYDGAMGSPTMHTFNTGFAMDTDPTAAVAPWRHVAFSFENGVAKFYMDSTNEVTLTLDPSQKLYWGDGSTGAKLYVGIEMDGYDFSKTADDNGFIDELRFSQGALDTEDLLPGVPEPSASSLILGISALLCCGRRRPKKRLIYTNE